MSAAGTVGRRLGGAVPPALRARLRLFRLSPRHPARQTLYTFTRCGRLLDVFRAYAAPL